MIGAASTFLAGPGPLMTQVPVDASNAFGTHTGNLAGRFEMQGLIVTEQTVTSADTQFPYSAVI